MSDSTLVTTALCLKTSELEALLQGRSIAALTRSFINGISQFALCPVDAQGAETIAIQAWAKLEFCRIYTDANDLKVISALTGFNAADLQTTLQEYYKIFLAGLRVYSLPQPMTISADRVAVDRAGSFIKLPHQLPATTDIPVLTKSVFQQRCQQLIRLELPQHADLEQLHDQILSLPHSSGSNALLQDLKAVLGWSNSGFTPSTDPDFTWIQTIADTGNSSDGNVFEKLVRQSLIKLGFSNSLNNIKASLDPNATGGAGGIDVYCDAPFPLVGECKASKHQKVPNTVTAQLIHLGNTHLGKQQFDQSIKVIFAAGALNSYAEQAAVQHQMNVIRPETLQRLVELKVKHPGSIDLLELKPCLEEPPFGESSDSKVNAYVDRIWERLKLRAHIISLVKRIGDTSVDVLYGAYLGSQSSTTIDREIFRSILNELASPLTGYLGRRKSRDGDRFYFLRSLDLD